ncbi:VHS domain [Trypanosoma melophagium]|uniref:VHS domain n=1 Tax=Trypanosoma melophagium TaxID=715481 RepID=UPI003519E6DD|nr:VHS domain [Trypanosoma melophagium]
MVVLSFMEKVRDQASRLLPNDYMETVEEATLPHLMVPERETLMYLCDCVNRSNDAIVDIVRAIRRRITDNDAKVQYLTVLLLNALVRHCVIAFHIELASQKGLLRDLQNIAIRYPCVTEREQLAKDAALELILNLSIWFTGHRDGRLYILASLSDDVRMEAGANAFENIHPDTNTRIEALKIRRQSSRQQQQQQQQQSQLQQSTAPIVNAIGVNFPTDEQLAAMVECCTTFAEYMNNANVKGDGSIEVDDVILEFRKKISSDHAKLSLLLGSDLKLTNRDVLTDISNSQTTLLQRLQNGAKSDSTKTTLPPPQRQQQEKQKVVTPTQQQESEMAAPAAVQMPPISRVEPTETQGATNNVIDDLFETAAATITTTTAGKATAPSSNGTEEVVQSSGDQETIEQQPQEEKENENQQTQGEPTGQQNEQSPSAEDDFDAFLEGRSS